MNAFRNIVLLIILTGINILAHGQDIDYSSIDEYARKTPISRARSVKVLTTHLIKPAKNDFEKARAFYVFIAENIKYDTKKFFSGDRSKTTVIEILRQKKAICQGYSELFKALCDEAGIECYVIAGYDKGFRRRNVYKFEQSTHAWNVLKIENKWYLIDVTWASGVITEKRQFQKEYNSKYFLEDPKTFVYKHLPELPMWQLLDCTINLQTFAKDSASIKKSIEQSKNCFNYNDSIKQFLSLPHQEQKFQKAVTAFRFNPKNYEIIGLAYLNYGAYLSNNTKELQEKKDYKALYKVYTEVYELNTKAISYLSKVKTKGIKPAMESAKNNRKLLEMNIKTLEKALK